MNQATSKKQYYTREFGRKNQPVVLILAGWKTRLWMYWPVARILALRGYYPIVYAYDDEVFSPNPARTLKSITAIADVILLRISELKNQGHKDFSIFSFSLGTLIGLMVANNSPDVSKVILNLVGTGPAETVWSWDKLYPDFEQKLHNQHLTLDNLSKIWAPIAPVNNISRLRGKKLLIYLTKRDKVIPYDHGLELVGQIKTAGYDYRLITNHHLVHAHAGVYNFANMRTYLDFLRS